MINASLRQTAFQFRDDDAASGTPLAAENVDAAVDPDANVRVRIEVQDVAGGALNNTVFQLQYSLNGGAYTDVNGTSTVVRSAPSPYFTDGTATADELTTTTGTFLAGEMDDVDGSTGNISFVDGVTDHTEVEYNVVVRSVDVAGGDTVAFRVTSSGAVLGGGYAHTPTLTVAVSNSPPNEPLIETSATAVGDSGVDLDAFVSDPDADDVYAVWEVWTADGLSLVEAVPANTTPVPTDNTHSTSWTDVGLAAGDYQMRAWAVDTGGLQSATFDSLAFTVEPDPVAGAAGWTEAADGLTAAGTVPASTYTGTATVVEAADGIAGTGTVVDPPPVPSGITVTVDGTSLIFDGYEVPA